MLESRDVPDVSVVVPVLDGAGTIEELHRRLLAARGSDRWEVIYVDDGSTDATWELISRFATEPGVRGIRLVRNSGHAAAVAAGFADARGGVVAMIDVDLETEPEDLPRLIAEVQAGADLASGRRTSTRRWERELGSRIFNAHARRLGMPLHDVGCGMNAMSTVVAKEFVAAGNVGRALVKPYLYAAAGRTVEVEVASHRPADSRLRAVDLLILWLRFDVLRHRLPFAWVSVIGSVAVVAGAAEVLAAVIGAAEPGAAIAAIGVLTIFVGVLLVALGFVAGLALAGLANLRTAAYRVAERTGPRPSAPPLPDPPADDASGADRPSGA